MPVRHRVPPLARALAFLPLLLASCAPHRQGPVGQASLLSSAPTRLDRPERACRVADWPEALPQSAALLDEPAFLAAATSLWKEAGGAPGHVLFSLRYDRYGLNVRRAVLEHSVAPALADTLQKLLFAHRRQADEARHEWGVRLRLDLGDAPALRVGRLQVCTPVPRDGGQRLVSGGFGDVRDGVFAGLNPSTASDPGVVWVRVSLDEAGMVTNARVERSLLRGPGEMRILGYVRTIAFLPAMEDGYPVRGEASIPIRLPE